MAVFHSFLWLSSVCVCRHLLIQSSIDGHLSCFWVSLAVVNRVAVKIGVHISFWICLFIFFRYILRSGISGWHGSLVLSFWGTSTLYSILAAISYKPTNTVQAFLFSMSSPTYVICGLFKDNHSEKCEVISHWDFDFNFFDD